MTENMKNLNADYLMLSLQYWPAIQSEGETVFVSPSILEPVRSDILSLLLFISEYHRIALLMPVNRFHFDEAPTFYWFCLERIQECQCH
jgi:hypothetical protein